MRCNPPTPDKSLRCGVSSWSDNPIRDKSPVWGSPNRIAWQDGLNRRVKGHGFLPTGGHDCPLDRIEFGGQAVDSARVSRPEERLWDRHDVGSPMNTNGCGSAAVTTPRRGG